jgi:hypothetical protein
MLLLPRQLCTTKSVNGIVFTPPASPYRMRRVKEKQSESVKDLQGAVDISTVRFVLRLYRLGLPMPLGLGVKPC